MNKNRNVAKKYRENKNRELLQALIKRNKEQSGKGDADGKTE